MFSFARSNSEIKTKSIFVSCIVAVSLFIWFMMPLQNMDRVVSIIIYHYFSLKAV